MEHVVDKGPICQGVPVLTYKSGMASTSEFEYGSINILNQQYLKIYQVTLQDRDRNSFRQLWSLRSYLTSVFTRIQVQTMGLSL